MFERFTTAAREVVIEAQAGARRLGHHHVGTEHLLLALSATADPVGEVLRGFGVTSEAVLSTRRDLVTSPGSVDDREALAHLGIDLDAVRRTVEERFGPGALDPRPPRRRWRGLRRRQPERCAQRPRTGHIPFSPRAKRVLERSLREALQLRHRHVGAEHIMLAITVDDGLAAAILVRLGVPPATVRAVLVDSLRRTA
jgi:ATP-dependent Clp protease ATP-binding subunit ClpA